MRSELIAGDTLDFTTSVPDYPASAGWTLTYKLIPRTAGTVISFNAAADGDDYRAQVAAATTAAWAAGEYSWTAYAIKAGERHTVEQGTVKILADPAVVTAYDGRSHARKVLEAIEAVLENRATLDQKSYAIGGRSLERTPIADLLVLRDKYKSEVVREDAASRVANGLSGRGRLLARG